MFTTSLLANRCANFAYGRQTANNRIYSLFGLSDIKIRGHIIARVPMTAVGTNTPRSHIADKRHDTPSPHIIHTLGCLVMLSVYGKFRPPMGLRTDLSHITTELLEIPVLWMAH